MKGTPLQPKYRYFVGLELPNCDQSDISSYQHSKSKTPHRVGDRTPQKGGAVRVKSKSKEKELREGSQNLKGKYADEYISGQAKYDYGLILTEKSPKNLPESSPINKLSPVKIEQAIQEANQTKKFTKKQRINDEILDHKQNKKPAIYLPFSPKEKYTEFYQPVPCSSEQNFVNPYYQTFMLDRKNNKSRQNFERKLQNKSEVKIETQRDKSPRSIVFPSRQQKMYMCKMDEIEKPQQSAKTKPKKDNSPYLLNFYQNNPQTHPIRYNVPSTSQQNKYSNRKTNQIYSISTPRMPQQPTHH